MNRLLLGIVAVLFMPMALAAKPPIFATDQGAIRGYDPVAYFSAGEPTRGMDKYSTQWQGASYKFASADNLALFKSDPERYAPQYGGYCAFAVSKGSTASTDPEAWTIIDGKLYLNYSKSVKKRWSKDIPGNISKADNNWPDVLN